MVLANAVENRGRSGSIVSFEAAYRFDGADWEVVGELDVPGETMRVRVVTVETRLTRGSCRDYPDDPGCN